MTETLFIVGGAILFFVMWFILPLQNKLTLKAFKELSRRENQAGSKE